MAEEVLEPPGIHSPGRQGVTRRVAQHVNMDREGKPGGFASPFYHAPDAHTAERLAALVDEDVAGLDAFSGTGAPEVAQRLVFQLRSQASDTRSPCR